LCNEKSLVLSERSKVSRRPTIRSHIPPVYSVCKYCRYSRFVAHLAVKNFAHGAPRGGGSTLSLQPINTKVFSHASTLEKFVLCYTALQFTNLCTSIFRESPDSSARIATRYGLEGPGIESRWGEIFLTYPGRLQSPPSLLYNGYRVFPGGKGGRGVMLTTHPLLVPRLRKS
jgi:hypothetical protein